MLIVFVGKIGCGKTTASKYLSTKYNFKEIAFADPLKKFAMNVGFTHNQVYGTQEEKEEINEFWGMSGRKFMQIFGTDIMRKQSFIENFWVRVLEQSINKSINQRDNFVVSDGRFLDEIEMIRRKGGIVVRILRNDSSEHSSENSSENSLNHSSEKEIDEITPDFVINNLSNNKEDFYIKIDEIIEKL